MPPPHPSPIDSATTANNLCMHKQEITAKLAALILRSVTVDTRVSRVEYSSCIYLMSWYFIYGQHSLELCCETPATVEAKRKLKVGNFPVFWGQHVVAVTGSVSDVLNSSFYLGYDSL